ncbi:MAG: LLM class flavin-dependent oxidoreductase [Actinomycetota bacterium]|nr:LLM class flavin-dependent oxidoreductase [Actinomycetota bacterium]
MKVGIYFDLRNPPEWPQDPTRLYGFALEMCEEAERLGCDSVWTTEHHLFDDGYMTQPLGFLNAVAARTRAVRLGTAIVIAPLHHPVEIAEQAAMVDILSGGRLDLGLGAGYRIPEFELFGKDLNTRYGSTDAAAREVRRLFAEGGLTPRPVQADLPIWMGYAGPQGARRAGLLGAGLLTANGEMWPHYRDALIEGGHDPATGRMAGGVQGFVTEDPERDWALVSKHLAYQLDSYRRHMVEGTGRPTPRPVDPDKVRKVDPNSPPLSSFLYGTPEEFAATVIASTAGTPVETVFIWACLGGAPEELTAQHVHTICTRLRPLLADA